MRKGPDVDFNLSLEFVDNNKNTQHTVSPNCSFLIVNGLQTVYHAHFHRPTYGLYCIMTSLRGSLHEKTAFSAFYTLLRQSVHVVLPEHACNAKHSQQMQKQATYPKLGSEGIPPGK